MKRLRWQILVVVVTLVVVAVLLLSQQTVVTPISPQPTSGGVYTEALLAECLRSVGYGKLAETIGPVSSHIQKLRWRTRLATGFDPRGVTIPKRFTEIVTWKGQVDEGYLGALKEEYARRILEMGKTDM